MIIQLLQLKMSQFLMKLIMKLIILLKIVKLFVNFVVKVVKMVNFGEDFAVKSVLFDLHKGILFVLHLVS